MVDKMIRVEFYGAKGCCTVCHQPLEGRGCPYCGWEDKNPPQYGYTKATTFDDLFAKCEEDVNFRREYLRVSMDENVKLVLENKALRAKLETLNIAYASETTKVQHRLDIAEELLSELLDGLDANTDERCGLSQKQWDKRVLDARKFLDTIGG